jgi:hypothetical protein
MENEQVVIIGNKITVQILRDGSKLKKLRTSLFSRFSITDV